MRTDCCSSDSLVQSFIELSDSYRHIQYIHRDFRVAGQLNTAAFMHRFWITGVSYEKTVNPLQIVNHAATICSSEHFLDKRKPNGPIQYPRTGSVKTVVRESPLLHQHCIISLTLSMTENWLTTESIITVSPKQSSTFSHDSFIAVERVTSECWSDGLGWIANDIWYIQLWDEYYWLWQHSDLYCSSHQQVKVFTFSASFWTSTLGFTYRRFTLPAT